MSSKRSALLRACLLASVPIATLAQAPVVVEAESGALGASLTTGTDTAANVNYITVLPAANSGNNPTPDRVATYSVTFPAAGNYALYVRIQTGPVNANDDSFFVPSGFNTSTSWGGFYNSSSGGATAPDAGVPTGGTAGQNVWKWVRMTNLPGAGGGTGPANWVVPDGALTQSWSWGSREDGLLFDKFAFGPVNSCYTVADLDAVRAPSISCPPPPPPDPPEYERTGQPLATGQAKFLGSAWSPGNASRNFGVYWNQVTPENAGKWGSAQPTSPFGPAPDYVTNPDPPFNFAQAHAAEDQARDTGSVFKWHVLFWGNQQPGWIENLPIEKQQEAIRIWLAAIAREFPDLEQIEVVNEPLHDPPNGPTNGNYYNALGGAGATGWDWIINAFTLAREYFPNAKLMLNDYSITNDGNATTRYLEIIELLKARNLIDLVGIQAHAFEFNYNNLPGSAATHTSNLARLKAAGLPVYVTEFDIDGIDSTWGLPDDPVQLERFRALFPVFWENDAVQGVTLWGYMRGSHWRTNQGAWLMYPNGAERPALQWLVRYMENKIPAITAGQAFSVDENVAGGTVIGTVAVTDGDGDALSQWQLTDASGKFVIDDTGTISLAAGASLDFETATNYSVGVSAYDGYRRSPAESVTINLDNLNDNAPVLTAGQSYRIDGGSRNFVAEVLATDADDTNEPGFTELRNWVIRSGNTHGVFAVDSDGDLAVNRPLLIDWRKSSYSLAMTVGDGTFASAIQSVQITIPNRVRLCLGGAIALEAPKSAAPLLILLGAKLGSCGSRN